MDSIVKVNKNRSSGVRPVQPFAEGFRRVQGFELACESRLIDCLGIESLEQDLLTTRTVYETDPTTPPTISFTDAWQAIQDVVGFLDSNRFTPFEFPLLDGRNDK